MKVRIVRTARTVRAVGPLKALAAQSAFAKVRMSVLPRPALTNHRSQRWQRESMLENGGDCSEVRDSSALECCLSSPYVGCVYLREETVMSARKRRSVVESVFDRNQRREAEINEALKQDAARHAAVVKNMQRLRALRLAREELRLAREELRLARKELRLAREEKSKEQPLTRTTVQRQTTGGGLTINGKHNVNFR